MIGMDPSTRTILNKPVDIRDMKDRICSSLRLGSLYDMKESAMLSVNSDGSKVTTSRY